MKFPVEASDILTSFVRCDSRCPLVRDGRRESLRAFVCAISMWLARAHLPSKAWRLPQICKEFPESFRLVKLAKFPDLHQRLCFFTRN